MSVTRTLDAAVDACAATSRAFTPARDGAERALVVDGSAVLRREDFGALQPEGEIAGGRSGDQADHDQRHCERPASVSMCAASERSFVFRVVSLAV